MTSWLLLITMAHQFLTARNWWQFHNPKNDAINIQVEIGELMEHFISYESKAPNKTEEIAHEMADVLFAIFTFAAIAKIDIANSLTTYVQDIPLKDATALYENLNDLVRTNLSKFKLEKLNEPQQVVLSLGVAASKLSDFFIWCSSEQSLNIAHDKHPMLTKRIASLIAHLVYLANLTAIDLPEAYKKKMDINAKKYPKETATGKQYEAIKDHFRKN